MTPDEITTMVRTLFDASRMASTARPPKLPPLSSMHKLMADYIRESDEPLRH